MTTEPCRVCGALVVRPHSRAECAWVLRDQRDTARAELRTLVVAMWGGDDKPRLLALRSAARALVEAGCDDATVAQVAGMEEP